jgi:hypothetical protein
MADLADLDLAFSSQPAASVPSAFRICPFSLTPTAARLPR